MPIFRIADLNIKINPVYDYCSSRMTPYLTDAETVDFEICVTDDEISEYIRQSKTHCTRSGAESVLMLTKLCNTILERFDGFFFHSSSLMFENEAYVFTALSGTGKSTHTALWRKHFGGRVKMINDDKPIIRKHDGSFFIYGTPWMGKSDIGNNIKAPVKAVYILQRGTKNSAVRVRTGDVFKQILEATLIPTDKKNMITLLSLLDEFFTSVPLYLLTCNTDESAVQTAYDIANKTEAKEID